LLYQVVVWDDPHHDKQKSNESSPALAALQAKPPHFVHTTVRHVVITSTIT
jgi:hypothetical protein